MYQSREEIEKFVEELKGIPMDDGRKATYLADMALKVALDIRDMLKQHMKFD